MMQYTRFAKRTLPPIDDKLLSKWRSSMQEASAELELLRLLQRLPLFSDTSESFRTGIIKVLLPVEYHTGQLIFRQGDPGDWMGILLCGRLERRVIRDHADGEVIIGEVFPGNVIGDLGLFGISETRTVSCVATEPSTLVCLERRVFLELIQDSGGPTEFPLFEDAHQMQNLMGDSSSFLNLKCWQHVEQEFVQALLKHLEPRIYYPGMVLMRENEHGNEMYIVHTGTLNIDRNGVVVDAVEGPVLIGELAVIGNDKRRTATISCTKMALVYVLHGEVFKEVLSKFPDSKQVFDHAFISRLCKLQLQKVKDEVCQLNEFYGRAHPLIKDHLSQTVQASLVSYAAHDATTMALQDAPPE